MSVWPWGLGPRTPFIRQEGAEMLGHTSLESPKHYIEPDEAVTPASMTGLRPGVVAQRYLRLKCVASQSRRS